MNFLFQLIAKVKGKHEACVNQLSIFNYITIDVFNYAFDIIRYYNNKMSQS